MAYATYGVWGGVAGFLLGTMMTGLFCSAGVTIVAGMVAGLVGHAAMTVYGHRKGDLELSWRPPSLTQSHRKRTTPHSHGANA